jgi:hypothetical protein
MVGGSLGQGWAEDNGYVDMQNKTGQMGANVVRNTV